MIPVVVRCNHCGAEIKVDTYREFVQCPYCETRMPFDGFAYKTIDWRRSMYSAVEYWTDCPACRSGNMYLGASGHKWKCPDCGYTMTKRGLRTGVLWFCDECGTFLNVQPGFTTKNKTWKCACCGSENDVTKDNIL